MAFGRNVLRPYSRINIAHSHTGIVYIYEIYLFLLNMNYYTFIVLNLLDPEGSSLQRSG